MAIPTAATLTALSAENSGDNTTELGLIETALTARANDGFYFLLYVLTVPRTKAAVIAELASKDLEVEVLDDGITLKISWPEELP